MSTDSGESDSITGMEGRSGLCVPSCTAPSCLGALGWRWLGELLGHCCCHPAPLACQVTWIWASILS